MNVPKTYLGCDTFQCIIKEVSVSVPTLQVVKQKLRREIETREPGTESPKSVLYLPLFSVRGPPFC